MKIILILYHIKSLLKKLYYRILLGQKFKFGKNFTFRKGFSILVENDARIIIGRDVFFNNYCSIAAQNEIVIGDGTIFGENVKIYDHNHIFRDKHQLIKLQGYTTESIIIGNHCWIGSNVTILKGVTIGDNVVIGAGCVIHMNVPANTIIMNKQSLMMQIY